MFLLSLVLLSVEFPICTAPGDQLCPDVCWDGQSFWVVWAENQGDSGKIAATKITEGGIVQDPFFVCSPGKGVSDPSLACSPDTLLLTYTRQVPDSADEDYLCFTLLDPSGIPYYGSGGIVGIFAAGPIKPVRCNEHFALLYTYGYSAGFEYPTWGEVSLLDGNTPVEILDVPAPGGQFCSVGDGLWMGKKLLCITSNGCIWLEDELHQNPHQEGYFYPRNSFYECEQVRIEDRIGWLYYPWGNGNPVFDILDSNGNPLNPEPLELNSGKNFIAEKSISYGCERIVVVSELSTVDNPGQVSLYGTEIDTTLTRLNEGFLTAGPCQESKPDIAFGSNHFLLVWCDNRAGNWDIYGRIIDSLEYPGIEDEKPDPVSGYLFSIDQPVFTDRLGIKLSSPASEIEKITIRDALGRTVNTLSVDRGCSLCIWNGLDSKGEIVRSGVYFISLELNHGRALKAVKF